MKTLSKERPSLTFEGEYSFSCGTQLKALNQRLNRKYIFTKHFK